MYLVEKLVDNRRKVIFLCSLQRVELSRDEVGRNPLRHFVRAIQIRNDKGQFGRRSDYLVRKTIVRNITASPVNLNVRVFIETQKHRLTFTYRGHSLTSDSEITGLKLNRKIRSDKLRGRTDLVNHHGLAYLQHIVIDCDCFRHLEHRELIGCRSIAVRLDSVIAT